MQQHQTFKQYIKENRHILQQQDHIFISRQFYNWGIIDVREVNMSNVYEVYDLIEKRFYYKQPLPFEPMGGASEGHYMLKPFDSAHGSTVDLAPRFATLERRNDHIIFTIEYPNEYHIKNKLIIIANKSLYESMTNEEREVYIVMNAYINLVQRRGQHYTIPPQSEITELLSGEILHWVWFRKNSYRFTEAQMERAISWIQLNPELKFKLWTDMEDRTELEDFLADVPEDARHLFMDKVDVSYRKSTTEFVRGYFEKYKTAKAIRVFDKENFTRIIEERDNSDIMIAKTDYLRAMILHDIGGFYADFNDCQCASPMRYWMRELFRTQEIIWPCDTYNPKHISNYFMYVPRGSKRFEQYHYKTMSGFGPLWRLMKNPETKPALAKVFIDMAKKYIKKLKANPTTQPTKLLVETIMPVFSSGKYLADMEDIVGREMLKGIDYCDPRGRIFMPMFCLEYLSKKAPKDRVLVDFYKYISAEFTQIGQIQPKKNYTVSNEGKIEPGKERAPGDERFTITYLNKSYFEEYDDIDEVVDACDDILAKIATLYDDLEFHEHVYKRFRTNMSIAIVALTNLMLQNDATLTLNDVVPFSFAYMSFCYLTLVVHWGDGTSTGTNDDS